MPEPSFEVMSRIVSPEKITSKLHDTAESIRDYSRLQVGLWRMLPMLGLESQGRGGYSGQTQWLYEYGVYRVNDSEQASGMVGTYVDCESGELLYLHGKVDLESKSTDEAVLNAWLSRNGKTFDAEAIVNAFLGRIDNSGPETTDGKTAGQAIEWRQDLATKLGLKAVYQRRVPEKV